MINTITFPKMFNKVSTNVSLDNDATKQNIVLFLGTEEGDFFGDPYFGIRLKRFLFEQNNVILKDILIDEIYIKLATFFPQLRFQRKDIDIIIERASMYVKIKATDVISRELNTYNLQLYSEEN